MKAHHEGWNFSRGTAVLDTWSTRMWIGLWTGVGTPPYLAARVLYAKIFWRFQTVPWVHFSGSKLQAAQLFISDGLFEEAQRILLKNGPNSTLLFVRCCLPLYCSAGKNKVWFMAQDMGMTLLLKKICEIKCWKPLFECTTKAHCNRANKGFKWEWGSQCQDHLTLWQPLFWLLYRSFIVMFLFNAFF